MAIKGIVLTDIHKTEDVFITLGVYKEGTVSLDITIPVQVWERDPATGEVFDTGLDVPASATTTVNLKDLISSVDLLTAAYEAERDEEVEDEQTKWDPPYLPSLDGNEFGSADPYQYPSYEDFEAGVTDPNGWGGKCDDPTCPCQTEFDEIEQALYEAEAARY